MTVDWPSWYFLFGNLNARFDRISNIRMEKSEEKHREEALDRSHEAGKVMRPSGREQRALMARVEMDVEIECDRSIWWTPVDMPPPPWCLPSAAAWRSRDQNLPQGRGGAHCALQMVLGSKPNWHSWGGTCSASLPAPVSVSMETKQDVTDQQQSPNLTPSSWCADQTPQDSYFLTICCDFCQ